MVNELTNTSIGLPIGADGSITYSNPAPGRYHATIAAAGYYITRVTASGAEINDGSFEVVEGAMVHLNIEATDDSCRVKGLVKNGDKPVSQVLVVLAPKDAAGPVVAARGFQTESDGSFDLLNVPAGDYLMFTSDKMDLEYRMAEGIRSYLAAATAIHLEAHQTLSQNLTYAATPPAAR
jgi:hypothetical protein